MPVIFTLAAVLNYRSNPYEHKSGGWSGNEELKRVLAANNISAGE
jgi:hypothetical protein